MAMASGHDLLPSREVLIEAISDELTRQARLGAQRIDVTALAEAIRDAIEATPPSDEGRRPEELNATNDD